MVMADAPITVGIAGLGRSGWNIHAAILAELPTLYRVQGVFDIRRKRQDEAATRFDCRTYTDYPALVSDEDIELVVVALPSHLHADASVEALAAGKMVVCEKPMATSLADADRMIAAADSAGALLTVFQNRRYSPDFLKVRQIIESGVLGRVVLIHMVSSGFGRRWDWQTLSAYGGGTLNNNGVHSLDQALQLFGRAEPEVFCHLERTLTLGDADDHVKIILRQADGPMIDVELSSACAYPQPAWHVMGTLGGLEGSTSQLDWKYIDPDRLPERSVDVQPTPDRSYNREDLVWQECSWHVSDYSGPGQAGFYLDLYRTIRQGGPLAVTPQSVRRVVRLLEQCHQLSPV
jgi:predicted dehydrogenase